jgi:hypothetical protein
VRVDRAPSVNLKTMGRSERAAKGIEAGITEARRAPSAGRLTRSAASKKPKGKKAQRLVYHHGSLPISAAFTLRYSGLLMRGWAASGTAMRACEARGRLEW